MDLKPFQKKAMTYIKMYRYVFLVIVIGIILMMLPIGKAESKVSKKENSIALENKNPAIDEKLADFLSQVSGVGKVRVFLTINEGEETIYQTDNDTVNSNENQTVRIETVILTDANRNQAGLIRQINPATFKGAVIVCDGADDPAVRLAVVDAVSKATGLTTNKISVLKMK